MGDLVEDLIEVFQGTVVSKDDVRQIVAEQRPGSPEVAHAMNYLRRNFPLGMLSRKIVELPGAPFHPITLRRAAVALNSWRRDSPNILAFPRIKKYGGKSC